jgi:purine-nucleoside phosphorylase
MPSPPATADEALINPRREPGEDPVAARTVLTFARPDYQLLCRLAGAGAPPRHIWGCAIRGGVWQGQPLTIVAPAVGAPYAALVLEKLIALGARRVLALGWCGSLQPQVGLGSLVLPTAAMPGDGTSRHYVPGDAGLKPDPTLLALLRKHLKAAGVQWHEGPLLTTDAFYRETVGLVRHWQARGVLGVDLELAALLAVGQFRRVPVAALTVVSDELGSLRWRPGYRRGAWRRAREQAAHLVLAAATQEDRGA